jgi:hypothetical protein
MVARDIGARVGASASYYHEISPRPEVVSTKGDKKKTI